MGDKLIKLSLVSISGALAFIITTLMVVFTDYIPYNSTIYIVSGTMLTYFTILQYDVYMRRKRRELQDEIRTLSEVAFQKYHIPEEENSRVLRER